jgi:hypothetical protein
MNSPSKFYVKNVDHLYDTLDKKEGHKELKAQEY